MSQKRVAIVLASLVATMTVSAGALLLMSGGPLGALPPQAVADIGLVRQLVRPEAPLQNSAWDYIIIYQSGDLSASAGRAADALAAGGRPSSGTVSQLNANFHFVVDSTRGRTQGVDGKLSVGSSWRKQESGAPHAGWPDPRYYRSPYYKNAIGVCLMGDLKQRPVSDAQYRSLLQLSRELQSQLRIPKDRVLFQWELDPNAAYATEAQKAFAAEFRRAL